jgi:multiple sugar transport system substrate-binding protein
MASPDTQVSRPGSSAESVLATSRRGLLRRTRDAAFVAGGAAFAAACGAPGTPAAGNSPTAAPYTVIMGNKFGGEGNSQPERMDWMAKSHAEFNRINGPKLTVDHVVLNTTEALTAALAANTGPDVAHASGAFFSDFADKKQWVEITQYVKRDKVDMNRWYIQEEVLYRNGKHYCMPFWQAAGTYFYNKTLFNKLGVKPPSDETWTWNEMLEAARQLTVPTQSWGFQTGYAFEFSWINFLRSAGENWINKEKTKTTLNTAGAVQTFQWLVDLVQRHKVMAPQGDTTAGTGNLWQQGKVGIMLGSNGTIGSTIGAKVEFDWDIFVTPKHPTTGKRGISANENPWVATKDSKNPEAAYKLMSFYSDSYSDSLVGKNRINMPSLKTAAADPASWLASPPLNIKASLETIKHAQSLDFHLNWNDWNTQLIATLTPAFKGEMSVKEACDKATQIGDSLLRGA